MSGFVTRQTCTRAEADAVALADEPLPGFEPQPIIAAAETEAGWELRLYSEDRPDGALLAAFAGLAPSGGGPLVEALPDDDWVTLSQAGLEPVDIGRFHVHTSEQAGRARPGQIPHRCGI